MQGNDDGGAAAPMLNPIELEESGEEGSSDQQQDYPKQLDAVRHQQQVHQQVINTMAAAAAAEIPQNSIPVSPAIVQRQENAA